MGISKELKIIIEKLPNRKFPDYLYDMPVKHLNNGITTIYIGHKIYHYKTVRDGFIRCIEITTKKYGISLKCAKIGAKGKTNSAAG